jgi:hypothetical protein
VLRSRIATLEELFKKPAGDGEETKLRAEVLMCVSGLRLGWILKPFQQTQNHRKSIAAVAREVCDSTIRR